MKKVLVIFADGFEEMEALAPVDLLRRAGCEVTTCGLGKKLATSSRKITILTDKEISEVFNEHFDAVVIPGGMPGATNIEASKEARTITENIEREGGIIAAICASPAVVLARWGLLKGKTAVCYPDMETSDEDVTWRYDKVFRDNNIITSRGAGCAVEFALEIVSALFSKEKALDLANKIVYK